MDKSEYTEWVPAGHLVKGLFAMVSVIIVFVTFAVFLFGEGLLVEDILGVSLAWVILGILLLVYWNYRGLQIKITDQKLSVDYGRFDKKSLLLRDIVSCKKTKSFGRYLGVGVRVGFDGSLAYTTSFGSALEVTPKLGRVFVFSTKNPDKICQIIEANKASWSDSINKFSHP
jgi:hypothetical protein